jgi:hypothetical protein
VKVVMDLDLSNVVKHFQRLNIMFPFYTATYKGDKAKDGGRRTHGTRFFRGRSWGHLSPTV